MSIAENGDRGGEVIFCQCAIFVTHKKERIRH